MLTYIIKYNMSYILRTRGNICHIYEQIYVMSKYMIIYDRLIFI